MNESTQSAVRRGENTQIIERTNYTKLPKPANYKAEIALCSAMHRSRLKIKVMGFEKHNRTS